MQIHQFVHGLDFNDDFFIEKNVQPIATIDLHAIIMDRQRYLTPKWDASFSKFMAEATFVGTFEKARPQSRMDGYCTSNKRLANFIFSHLFFSAYLRGPLRSPR